MFYVNVMYLMLGKFTRNDDIFPNIPKETKRILEIKVENTSLTNLGCCHGDTNINKVSVDNVVTFDNYNKNNNQLLHIMPY